MSNSARVLAAMVCVVVGGSFCAEAGEPPAESAPETVHWSLRPGISLGGVVAPMPNEPLAWAITGDLSLTVPLFTFLEVRALARGVYAQSAYSYAETLAAGAQVFAYFASFMGVGIGGLGGWSWSARLDWPAYSQGLAVILVLSPLHFRFGDRIRHEIGIDVGPMFNIDVGYLPQPPQTLFFGRLVYTLTFDVVPRGR